jgi:hypothetical protein
MDVQISSIEQKLKTLGCSAESFCAFVEIPTARWSRALRGLFVFPGPELVRLSDVVRTMVEIRDAAAPVPVDFGDAMQPFQSLHHLKSRTMRNC